MSESINGKEPLLQVRDLQVTFGKFRAVDGISFDIAPGETLGLVGESGCGKTTTGTAIVNLVQTSGGSIRFDGKDITNFSKFSRAEQLKLRSEIQIVFQDPYSSLNPRMTLHQALTQPMKIHGIERDEREHRAVLLLEKVGLNPKHSNRYPHEFSGGQRQRIGIARALALQPKLIICDEAVSALDVSIQAQIINLLLDLQEEFKLSYLFISHDLAVVEHLADKIAVMYRGQIVEAGPYEQIFGAPQHSYTKTLLSAIPIPKPQKRQETALTLDPSEERIKTKEGSNQ